MISNTNHLPLLLPLGAALLVAVGLVGRLLVAPSHRWSVPPLGRTQVAVFPHHDLVLPHVSQYYAVIAHGKGEEIQLVILLAPNHFHAQLSQLASAASPLPSADGTVATPVRGLWQQLLEQGMITDAAMIAHEHAVQLHLPLIRAHFPRAAMVPILLTRNLSAQTLDRLRATLAEAAQSQSTIVLVSTDFSHNQVPATIEQFDRETLALIRGNQTAALRGVGDEHVDCSECLALAMRLVPIVPHAVKVLFHGNAAQYLPTSVGQSITSYYVLSWAGDQEGRGR